MGMEIQCCTRFSLQNAINIETIGIHCMRWRCARVRVQGGGTECLLQVRQLSRSSESTHFLGLRRDEAFVDFTRAPDDFSERRHVVPPFYFLTVPIRKRQPYHTKTGQIISIKKIAGLSERPYRNTRVFSEGGHLGGSIPLSEAETKKCFLVKLKCNPMNEPFWPRYGFCFGCKKKNGEFPTVFGLRSRVVQKTKRAYRCHVYRRTRLRTPCQASTAV